MNDPHRGGTGYRVWLPVADVTTDLSTLPNPPRLHPWPGDVARWGPSGRPPRHQGEREDPDVDDVEELEW